MVHAFNSRTWETRASGSESKSSLVYTVSYRTARATQKSLGKKRNEAIGRAQVRLRFRSSSVLRTHISK